MRKQEDNWNSQHLVGELRGVFWKYFAETSFIVAS